MKEAKAEVEGALSFALLCFIVDYVGILSGTTTFMNSINAIHIFLHFVGGLLCSWYLLRRWHFYTFWPIVLCTSFLAGLLELTILMARYIFKIIV